MIRKLKVCLAVIALLSTAFSDQTAAQEIKLYPVDEAAKDASFKRFRDRLIVALNKHDRKFLLSILHPKIQNSFGGNGGIKEFIADWKLNSPNSKVWTDLLTVLSLGGSFDTEDRQKIFIAPYVTSRWDSIQNKLPTGADAFSYSAIIAARVPLYSRPDASRSAIVFLSYDVVEVDYEHSVGKDAERKELLWVKIKTLKGQEGYVPRDKIRSAVDQRAYFKKVRGKWMMYIFIAGD